MNNSRRLTKDVIQEIKEMHEDGLEYNVIARYFGVAHSTVQYHCDKEKYAPRLRKATNKWLAKKRGIGAC